MKELNHEDLKKLYGGKLDNEACLWLKDRHGEILDRARERGNSKNLLKVLGVLAAKPGKVSLDFLQATIGRFVNIDDLI